MPQSMILLRGQFWRWFTRVADKVRVKRPGGASYYQWIAKQGRLKVPRWNFHKHLIDRDGHLVDWFAPTTGPSSAKLISAIDRNQISRLKALDRR